MNIVYLIKNSVNGKCYVGKTNGTFGARWKEHCSASRQGGQTPLYKAIRKYGQGAFKASILAHAPQNQLSNMEKIWIFLMGTKTPNGYNLTDGGEGVSGYKFTPAILNKISLSLRKTFADPAIRAKLSAAQTGRRHSTETKLKISQGNVGKNLGRKKSPETVEKIKRTLQSPAVHKKIVNSHKNIFPSLEARKRMSMARQGRTHSLETRQKISSSQKGKIISKETCEKISRAHIGIRHSEAAKRKMSISRLGNTYALGFKHSAETRKKVSDAGKRRWAKWRVAHPKP
jgi:group I intron endonuclease